MSYGNRMERSGTAWLTPRPGCGIPLLDGSIIRTGTPISPDDPVAQQYRHRLMILSAAPDPVRPPPLEESGEEGDDG